MLKMERGVKLMTSELKEVRTLTGILLRPLAVGSRAIIVHQGKITRTARITATHHHTAVEVCFETLDTRYYLQTGPNFEPAVSAFPSKPSIIFYRAAKVSFPPGFFRETYFDQVTIYCLPDQRPNFYWGQHRTYSFP